MVLLSTSLAKYSASLRAPAVNQNLHQRVIKEKAVPDEAEAALSYISPLVDRVAHVPALFCGSSPFIPTQKGFCPLIMSHNVPYFLETAPADKT